MLVSSSLILLADTSLGAGAGCNAWPFWQRFKELYLSADGRVVDRSTAQQVTTSEGQAYALFFALVGNDRAAFDQILRWTRDNLAGGDLAKSLPAWQWGRAGDGSWRVLDTNAAADADLWMAYALGEAARLWNAPEYSRLGAALAANILRDEVASIPGLGTALLPGPKGFVTERSWRLNPSYLPLPVIHGLARQSGDPRWLEIAQSSEKIILGSAPQGFAADWIEFTTAGGFAADPTSRDIGGYEAIRVYLWAGMLPASDPTRQKLAEALKPMLSSAAKRVAPAETIGTRTLSMRGEGAPGFSAALLPMLANARMSSALQSHRKRAAENLLKNDQNYYSDVLTLFGLGWLEQHYRFNRAGLLSVHWTHACDRPH